VQVSEVLEQWITLQRTWMYLEPIFSSDDIMQQLPLEGKRFATVDRSWRKTMDAAKRTPGVLKVCAIHLMAQCIKVILTACRT
jgi:dynein heavy chain